MAAAKPHRLRSPHRHGVTKQVPAKYHTALKFADGTPFVANSPYYIFAIPQAEEQNSEPVQLKTKRLACAQQASLIKLQFLPSYLASILQHHPNVDAGFANAPVSFHPGTQASLFY